MEEKMKNDKELKIVEVLKEAIQNKFDETRVKLEKERRNERKQEEN